MLLTEELSAALAEARASGHELLPERVALAVAGEIGLRVPRSLELTDPVEARSAALEALRTDRLVVKVRSASAAHKTDLGGVVFCDREPAALERALDAMARRVADRIVVQGFSVHELVDHDRAPGGELLLGVRWSDDFGPVAVLGLGGLEVERLARGGELAPLLVSSSAPARTGGALPASHPLIDFLTRPYRGRPGRWQRRRLEDLLSRLLAFAEKWMAPDRADRVADFEINPLVPTARGPVALDALLRRATATVEVPPPRPLDRLRHLLEPDSIAVAGVSRRPNVGRVILRNIARQGFDRDRLWVVKPGHTEGEEIEGCTCYRTFADLPETADLAVLAVGAARLPGLVEEIVDRARARTLILIPGGVGERAGSGALAASIDRVIRQARRSSQEGGGPLVNGGNCLGIRSVPGRYDTMFIPRHKLAFEGTPAPLALISQSGAFAIARASQLAALEPRYVVTLGNQIDLTLSDYLTYLERDSAVSVFACYIEGFRPLDGRAFLRSARRLTAAGRAVIVYRAGRTPAGARAAASHTASVAGSYRVTTELARRAGALLAESIEEFEDLTRVFCLLDGRRLGGPRLGAMSNAGFETVAMGDHLADLELARLAPATEERLAEIFRKRQIDSIVAPGNPLDVTPMLDDEAFAAAARVLLEDAAIDLGVVGCVPLTGALQTLPAGPGHQEDLGADGSVAGRLLDLWRASTKPWVAVVDAGGLYDPLARALESGGVPTFRSADRALRALATWARFQLRAADSVGRRSPELGG